MTNEISVGAGVGQATIVGEKNSMSLSVWTYNERTVRTVMQGDEIWWVAKDVCEVLGITDVSQAVKRVDTDDACQTRIIDSMGRQQETWVVNEPGLYSLILRSDKPQAKGFQRWVTKTVLPQIRQTGQYIARPKSALELMGETMQAIQSETTARIENLETAAQLQDERIAAIEKTVLPPKEVRKEINRYVRAYAEHLGGVTEDYQTAWERLYSELLYRPINGEQGVNIRLRAERAETKPLDLAQREGWLPQIHSIAAEMFGQYCPAN